MLSPPCLIINWILIVTNSQPKTLIYQTTDEKVVIKDTNKSDLEMLTKTLKFITKYQMANFKSG